MTTIIDEELTDESLPVFIETLRREVLILAEEMEKENGKRAAERTPEVPPAKN